MRQSDPESEIITRRQMVTRALGLALAGAAMTRCSLAADLAATTPAQKILTRIIPSSGDSIPVIGLGTARSFDPPSMDEKTLEPLGEVLQALFDGGGRVVDTAPSYGKAEDVVGLMSEKLKLNDKLFFATKVLTQGEAAGEQSYNNSLRRLKREKLELMQCHNFVDWATHLKTLRKWKDAGTFRYIGVTNHQDNAHEELERIIRRDKVDFLQTNYSIAEPKSADRLLPAAKELGVAVLINRPFAAGKLFARLRDKPLPDFARPFAATWAAAFLKFVIANEAVTCVIPATSKPAHMRDNLAAGFGRLPTAEELAQLRKLV